MKILSKIIGVLLLVFTIAFHHAEPLQKRHHHRGPYKSNYRGHHRPKYKKVVYHRAPRHYYKKYSYRPVRSYRHHPHKRYKHHRVYRNRPVVIIHR